MTEKTFMDWLYKKNYYYSWYYNKNNGNRVVKLTHINENLTSEFRREIANEFGIYPAKVISKKNYDDEYWFNIEYEFCEDGSAI